MNDKFELPGWVGYDASVTEGERFFVAHAHQAKKDVPLCPSCHEKLLDLLYIEANISRQFLTPKIDYDVVLYFCWQCKASETLIYQVSDGGGVRFVHWADGKTKRLPPFEPYPKHFDERTVLFVPQSIVSQAASLEYLNTFDHDLAFEKAGEENWKLLSERYQLGGIPYLHSELSSISCPICQRNMVFFATVPGIPDEKHDYTGYECVIMTYQICLECKVLATTHQVD